MSPASNQSNKSRNSNEVTVYTTQFCPYCVRAKALLKERGVPFREIQFDMDDDKSWDELIARSGMQTVPQIFHGDRLIGGYNELAQLDGQDRLASLKG
jgi:glutaredoxin 3